MVSYEVPKPPLGFFARLRESVRLAQAFIKGDRTTISDITSTTWMSPLQPLPPYSPLIPGRNWDYAPGINVQIIPRGYGSGRIPFVQLRQISRNCEIMRLVIETVKDQICSYDWQIVPREDSEVDPDDKRVAELTKFFKSPDKVHTYDQWLRMLLEELMVTDALTIYRAKDKVGRPYSCEIFDGATIKPLIDGNGRRPLAPEPAYQQILKGAPHYDYTTDELLYMPRNTVPYDPLYGLSVVEQVMITAETSLQRSKYQLAYFTEGSMPDAFAEMPPDMTVDQLKAFEEQFNNILAGNATNRRQVPFLPSGTKINPLKEPDLKNDADEWFTRIICFCFGIAPTAFIKQMNRSTSENDKQRAQEEGQGPKMAFIKSVMDILISDFGEDYSDNFEFSWREGKNQDPKLQADIATEYAKAGIKTIDEIRDELGLDPLPDGQGDRAMALTPTGYVPLDSFEQNMAQQQQIAEGAQDRAAGDQGSAGNHSPGEGGAVPPPATDKPTEKSLGKAVRHKPIPFRRTATRNAESQLTPRLHAILTKTAHSVAHQVRGIQPLRKDESDEAADAFVDALDLEVMNGLVTITNPILESVARDSGHKALMQIGIENRSKLVNQVNKDALEFARARSAEMVGKKWVGDELVDNPDAEWVIPDATRDELKSIIADVYSGALEPSKLQDAIMNAGAFSEDRAKLIARTETMNANAHGSLAGYHTARNNGVNVKKAWDPDAEACEICLDNADDGAIDLEDLFSSGDDAPPAHPNCECVLVPVVESDEGDDEDTEE